MQSEAAAIVLTRQEKTTLCEAFEVPPSRPGLGWKTRELLIRSYPALTVEIPNEAFDDGEFQLQLANVFSHPNVVNSDLPSPPHGHINKLFNRFFLSVDLAHDGPHAATQRAQLASALHGVDRTGDVLCITKRIHDYSILESSENPRPWRRSPLWLLIRVAIQMSANRSLERGSYKRFILFFMCTLARDENNTTLSSDLLHLMSSKILRRLSKLGFSTPHWLFEMLLKTGTQLNEILDAKQERLKLKASPFRNPSRQRLLRDTQLSLVDCGEYIRNALTNLGHKVACTRFHPNHCHRGTIEDFLDPNGTYFDEAYRTDPDGTLYDVEQSVEQGIEDWLARATNVDEACVQLEMLMEKWATKADAKRRDNPEGISNRFLTSIELFVALDRLVVKEIPMLADYSPEIPIIFLERLLLRKATSLHRLSRAYQYLSLRHSRSRPGWSLLSDEFTEDSFPVRYYDQSPYLQQLKVCIEQDMEKLVAHADPHLVGAILHSFVMDTKNSTRIPLGGDQPSLPNHRCLPHRYMRKSLYSSCNAQRVFVSGAPRYRVFWIISTMAFFVVV